MSLQDKTVVELKALARERGLKRYSKLKKDDLIQSWKAEWNSATT